MLTNSFPPGVTTTSRRSSVPVCGPLKSGRWQERCVTEKILRHLGAWHDPPARPPPQGVRGPYTYEPCLDADPMPDYENVLTD